MPYHNFLHHVLPTRVPGESPNREDVSTLRLLVYNSPSTILTVCSLELSCALWNYRVHQAFGLPHYTSESFEGPIDDSN